MSLDTHAPVEQRTLSFSRLIRAPRATVWAAWTDPNVLPLWWGPRGHVCRTDRIEIAEGGEWVFTMVPEDAGPDAAGIPNRMRFTVVRPMDRLEWIATGAPGDLHTFDAVLRLEDATDGTMLHGEMVFQTVDQMARMQEFGARMGALGTLDKLSERLLTAKGAPALSLTRILSAPPAAVWRAWTDAEALPQWFCPDDCDLADHHYDPRPGGTYRSVLREKTSGKDFVAVGTYLELEPERRLVFSHAWEQEDGAVSPETRVTIWIAPVDGGTQLHMEQEGLSSPETRDSHADGWGQCLDSLSRHLSHG